MGGIDLILQGVLVGQDSATCTSSSHAMQQVRLLYGTLDA